MLSRIATPCYWRGCYVHSLIIHHILFQDYLTCTKGEEIYGVFKLKPNTRNVRDLDIEIDVDIQGELSQISEKNKYKMR